MGENEKDDEFMDNLEDIFAEQDADEAAFDEELAMNTPEEQIAALEVQRDEFRDRFMRALADAENSRKRSERDRREAEKYGGSKMARDMLPVYDNLHRALDAATDEQKADNAAMFEGIELTLRELQNVFEKHGVTVIDAEVGQKFDANIHQAMFEAPLPGTKKDEIIQVMANGFMIHDRLLRPAQVGVSSNPG